MRVMTPTVRVSAGSKLLTFSHRRSQFTIRREIIFHILHVRRTCTTGSSRRVPSVGDFNA